MNYDGKQFANVSADNIDIESKEEKEQLEKKNEEYKDLFQTMKESLGNAVEGVRFTHRLKNHPVCLVSEGNISIEMEKVINSMPNNQNVKAKTFLEINDSHPISKKLKDLYDNNKETLSEYTKVLYSQARLIEGLTIENPTEISNLICKFMAE